MSTDMPKFVGPALLPARPTVFFLARADPIPCFLLLRRPFARITLRWSEIGSAAPLLQVLERWKYARLGRASHRPSRRLQYASAAAAIFTCTRHRKSAQLLSSRTAGRLFLCWQARIAPALPFKRQLCLASCRLV